MWLISFYIYHCLKNDLCIEHFPLRELCTTNSSAQSMTVCAYAVLAAGALFWPDTWANSLGDVERVERRYKKSEWWEIENESCKTSMDSSPRVIQVLHFYPSPTVPYRHQTISNYGILGMIIPSFIFRRKMGSIKPASGMTMNTAPVQCSPLHLGSATLQLWPEAPLTRDHPKAPLNIQWFQLIYGGQGPKYPQQLGME